MAQPDGSLVFDTKIITTGFNKGMAAIKTAAKGIGAITAGFAAATGAALKFAGELEQNLGGSEAVFKQYASTIQKTADTAFKNMGLSTADFLATANKMGALFQGSGFQIQESAELSAKTMQRAADVASIMGIDISMAMESIAGAAKGNFTMMDNLGVAMNDTTLAAYALEKGIAKSTRQMTNQEKIALAMQMFLEKTEYATGNYAKENETLAGSLATAKAALENFLAGTGKAEDLAESLSGAAQVIIKNIGELTPKLAAGLSDVFAELAPMMPSMLEQLVDGVLDGADELADSFGDMFSSVVTIAAGSAPDILDASILLMESFIDGIVDNSDDVVAAAIEVGEAVISGFVKIVPKAVSAAGEIAEAFADELGKAYPIFKPFTSVVKLLADNVELCAVAFGVWKTSAAITGIITTVTAGIKTLTTGVQGATVAQKLWNAAMSANPIGAVVTGVVALTAGIVALVAAFDNAPEWEKECEEIRTHRQELEKSNAEWQEVVKAQKNAEVSTNSEMNHIQKLSQELRGLADENGNVAESERARAQFILGELNEALGTEYSMNQGRISQYQQLSAEIDNLIAKKRAEALLSSKQDAYDSAVGQIGEKQAILQEETRQYQLAREEVERYTNQIEYLKQKQKELEETKPPDWEYEYDSLTLKIDDLNDELEGANAKLGEHKGAMDAASIAVNDLNTTISDYEGTYEKIIKGDYDAVFKGSYKSASGYADGTSAALTDGQSDVEATASSIGQDVANAVGDGLKIAMPNTESAMKEFGNQLNKTMSPVIEGARAEGENLILSLAGGVSLKITDAVTVSEDGSQKIIDGLKVSEAVAKQLGIDYIQGVMNGMDSMINPLWNKAFTIMQGMHEYGAKPGVRSNSPAKDGIDLGTDYVLGVEIGLEDEAPELNKTAKETAQDMNKSFADTLSKGMNTIRSEIASITGAIKEEAEKNVKAFDAELKKIEMLRDFGVDDEETYYRKLEFLRDNYLTKNSDKWIDITQELYDYQEAQLEEHRDNIEDVYDDIADHITDKLDEVAKKQQKFSDSLTDSTELFQKYTIDGVVHYKLNDFSSENVNLAAYQQWLSKAMERVKSSGASEDAISGVLDYIDGLAGDVSGMDALIALASASDADFAKFMSGYAQNLSKADGIAAQRYSDDMVTAAEESYQQMVDELTRAGLDIPEGFFVSGTLSAEQFGEAFLSEIELQMQEIRRKLTEFNAEINASIGAAAGNVTNDNRSTTYHIYGDNSNSTVKQIQNMETIKRLSGQ